MAVRPDWDDYFLGIADSVSRRADCTRRQVGAVIVTVDNRISSTGYNGSLPGHPGCLSGACPRGQISFSECPPGTEYGNCIAIHAEANALLYSDRSRHEGGTIYITCAPCDWCQKLIWAGGIKRIVWPGGEVDRDATSPEDLLLPRLYH